MRRRIRRFARRGSCASPLARSTSGCRQRHDGPFVKPEQMFHTLAVATKGRRPKETIDSPVYGFMRSAQVSRHHGSVIKISERCGRVRGSGVEHGLGKLIKTSLCCIVETWPWKKIVINARRVLIVTLQSAVYISDPSHMHARRHKSKMVQIDIKCD